MSIEMRVGMSLRLWRYSLINFDCFRRDHRKNLILNPSEVIRENGGN